MAISDTRADLAILAARWADLEAQRQFIDEAQAEIAEQFRALDVGQYDAGEYTVTITEPQRRFNPQLATQVLPPALIDAVSVARPDATTARKFLPAELFAACQKEVGEKRVYVR